MPSRCSVTVHRCVSSGAERTAADERLRECVGGMPIEMQRASVALREPEQNLVNDTLPARYLQCACKCVNGMQTQHNKGLPRSIYSTISSFDVLPTIASVWYHLPSTKQLYSILPSAKPGTRSCCNTPFPCFLSGFAEPMSYAHTPLALLWTLTHDRRGILGQVTFLACPLSGRRTVMHRRSSFKVWHNVGRACLAPVSYNQRPVPDRWQNKFFQWRRLHKAKSSYARVPRERHSESQRQYVWRPLSSILQKPFVWSILSRRRGRAS
jgi:hypothetical protein